MLTIDANPRGLRYLYAAIAGHAFAWYTIYNLFVFWLVSRGYSDQQAQAQYGNLVAAAYLLPLLGGLLASGLSSSWRSIPITVPALGPRRTALVGAVLASVGYFLATLAALSPTSRLLLPAVAAVVFGVGLSKPNLSALVGRMFPAGSELATRAFAKYYSYINVGAVLSPLLGGYLAVRYGYAVAFAPAIVGELVVAASLMLGKRHLEVAESPSSLAAAIGKVETTDGEKLPELPPLAVDHVGVDADPSRAEEMAQLRRRKLQALWLFFVVAAVGFWPAYNQNGSGLNIWALKHTDRIVWLFSHGYNVPAAWFAAINSAICIVATVPLVRLFSRVALSTSTAIGYLLMAASFGTLLIAPTVAAAPGYLVVAIVLSSLSEVLVSTIGLAQVAKLAPRHQASTYMAIWLLTNAVGGKLAGVLGSRLQLLDSFAVLAAVASVAAAVILLQRRRLDVAVNASAASQGPRRDVVATSGSTGGGAALVAVPVHSVEVA